MFFFKQKTAYELRISDWSSDVCSSDLRCPPCSLPHLERGAAARRKRNRRPNCGDDCRRRASVVERAGRGRQALCWRAARQPHHTVGRGHCRGERAHHAENFITRDHVTGWNRRPEGDTCPGGPGPCRAEARGRTGGGLHRLGWGRPPPSRLRQVRPRTQEGGGG